MIKNNIVRLLSLSLITALSGLPFITQSYASDGKMYAGSSCVRYSGASPTYSYGRIGNPSTTTDMYLDCPVVKDHIGYAFTYNYMRAADLSNTEAVTCRLYSAYRSGSSLYAWSGALLSTSTSGFGTNEIQSSSTADVSSNNIAHSYFSCKVPNRSVGISYLSSVYAEEY